MTHPFVNGLVRQSKMRQFHADADALLVRLARLMPGAKLTLVFRHPDYPDGERDALFTDDELPAVRAAIDKLAARKKQE